MGSTQILRLASAFALVKRVFAAETASRLGQLLKPAKAGESLELGA